MSRAPLAAILGTLGFLAYVAFVMVLSDHVWGLHWALEFLFFAIAGIAWVWPAKWLIVWAMRR